MADKKQIAQRKQELTTQLARKRQSITRGRASLKKKFQPKELLRKLLSAKPKSLFAGSAVAGLGAALFLRRPRKAKKTAQSARMLLLGWALALLKPTAKAWLIARAKQAATEQRPNEVAQRSPRY